MNCPKSLDLQKRAKKRIPGGTHLLSKRSEMFAPGQWPGYFSKAKGAQTWDLDGNCYTDMSISGIGATVLGFADDDVDNKVKEAISLGTMCSLNPPEEVILAERLCEIHPWAEMGRFTRSGGEAMTVAVRIARAFTGKDKILFCGYHGWHDWYLAANLAAESNLDGHLLPGLSPAGVPRGLTGSAIPFAYEDETGLEKLLETHQGQVAAIVMEPLRSKFPKEGFLAKVQALSKRYGVVLIFDEITAGFRIHGGGAHLLLGAEPDIAVFGKAISNGYPMGAIIGKKSVMDAAQNTFISSTYWTDRIGPVAALATIEKFLRHNVHKHLIQVGEKIQSGWKTLSKQQGLDLNITGIAPLSYFSFNYSEQSLNMATFFTQEMLKQGFLAAPRFYSSFAHEDSHIEKYLKCCEEIFHKLSVQLKNNRDIKELLHGEAVHKGFQRLT